MLKNKISVTVLLLVMSAAYAIAQTSGTSGELNVVKPVTVNKDLVIPVSEITSNAVFYPVDIDGTRLEVIAVRAPDGTIRTAFNTCQVCYSSGRGYYKQKDNLLICQNCKNRFRMSQVERQAGGCNPVPIYAENKTVTATTITISKEFLKQASSFFAKWSRRD
ncbi:MAG: DUF2318 domain-containing protein [Spirochaetaceae bacterium]|jgi:uncharacterized membrane protein|nr:DUF2318 domain-containing protein [Spirochaetaceae bacterium]